MPTRYKKYLLIISCVIAAALTLLFSMEYIRSYFGYTSHGGEVRTRLSETEVKQREVIREADQRRIKNIVKVKTSLKKKLNEDKKLSETSALATSPECEGMLAFKNSRVNGRELCFNLESEDVVKETAQTQQTDVKGDSSFGSFQCTESGDGPYRIQPVYLYNPNASGPSNASEQIKSALLTADSLYFNKSSQAGGYRRLKFVHDTNCNLKIITINVTDPTIYGDTYNLIRVPQQQGLTQSDRIYVAFTNTPPTNKVGNNLLGGLAISYNNLPNQMPYGPTYSIVYNFNGLTAVHELSHDLGAVLPDSPNSNGSNHVGDRADDMMYPVLSSVSCIDCGNDDYFNINPDPGSYIGTHWNIAMSPYLFQSGGPNSVVSPTPSALSPPPTSGVTQSAGPICTITPSQVSPGSDQSTTFSAQCNDSAGKLTQISLHISPTSNENWSSTTIANCTLSSANTNGTCQGIKSWSGTSIGNAFYVIVNASTSDGRSCTGNPWQVPYPWFDCSNVAAGNKDVATVIISQGGSQSAGITEVSPPPTPTADLSPQGNSYMNVQCDGSVNGYFNISSGGGTISGQPTMWMDDQVVGAGSNTGASGGSYTFQISGASLLTLQNGQQHKVGATLGWNGTYDSNYVIGQNYDAPGISIRYLSCSQTTAQSTPPTCTISGSQSVTQGTTNTFTGTCNDSQGDLTSVELYWSPTSTEQWNLISNAGCSASGTSTSCTKSVIFNNPGSYYIAVNGYKSGKTVSTASADKVCTGNPFQIAPGWSNCGSNDSLTVTVNSSALPPTTTPTPAQNSVNSNPTSCPVSLSPPSAFTQTSSGFQWNPVANATDYMIRVDNTTQGGWSGVCTSMNYGDGCQDFLKSTSYAFTFASGTSYDAWVHAYNSTCGQWSDPAKISFYTSSSQNANEPINNPPTPTPTRPTATPTPRPPTPTSAPSTDTWTYCAYENNYCYIGKPAVVKYGAYGIYTYKVVNAGISCTNSAFGTDPFPLVGKKCYYQLSQPSTPTATPLPPTATPTPTPIPDTIAPTTTITSPQSGARVTKNANVTVYASAQDNVGIAKTEFYINNVLQCTDTVGPYTCTWKTVNKGGVKINIEVRAYDTAGLWSARGIQVTTK